jgi:hypothetical protein
MNGYYDPIAAVTRGGEKEEGRDIAINLVLKHTKTDSYIMG